MNAFLIFLNDNFMYIGIIIVFITSLLVYISFNKIDLNKKTTKKLIQTVTVETFDNPNQDNESMFEIQPKTDQDYTNQYDFDGAKSFCKTYQGDSGKLNKIANSLTNENCKTSPCCVLVQGQNGNTCMAGDASGPTFKTDTNGNMISIDAYYYQGKKYGPPTLM